jgi:hypothetical protein
MHKHSGISWPNHAVPFLPVQNVLLRERNKTKRNRALGGEEDEVPQLLDAVVDEFFSPDPELRSHVISLAGPIPPCIEGSSTAEAEPEIETEMEMEASGEPEMEFVAGADMGTLSVLIDTAAAASVPTVPTPVSTASMDEFVAGADMGTLAVPNDTAAAASVPTLSTPVSTASMDELALVFPSEDPDALRMALIENQDDVEQAAMWLLDRPVDLRGTWSLPSDGQSPDLVQPADVVGEAMAMMSAAMSTPPSSAAGVRSSASTIAGIAEGDQILDIEAGSSQPYADDVESIHGNDLVAELEALSPPADDPEQPTRTKLPGAGVLRRLRVKS